MSSGPAPANDQQRALGLVHDLLADVGRDLDAWTVRGDREAGRNARGDLDVVIRYLREIHTWLLTALVLNDPEYGPTDPPIEPERHVEADRGPGM